MADKYNIKTFLFVIYYINKSGLNAKKDDKKHCNS